MKSLPPKKSPPPPPKLDNNQRLMVSLVFFAIFIVILSLALRPSPSAPTTQSQATTAPRPTLVPGAAPVLDVQPTNTRVVSYNKPKVGDIVDGGVVVSVDETGPGFMVIPPTSEVTKYDSQGTPIKNGQILPAYETPHADAPRDFVDTD